MDKLLSLPTLAVSRGWELKIDNSLGRIWVDPSDGSVQFYRWRDGDLHSHDQNGKMYTSLED